MAQTLTYTSFATPIGELWLAHDGEGVCALCFARSDTTPAAFLPKASRIKGKVTVTYDDTALAPYAAQVQAFLNGRSTSLNLPLHLHGTPFQQQVWQLLERIPFGETRSYREIAQQIKKPGAYRAVAQACATNPVMIQVACHRVIRSDGDISGYVGGVGNKRFLLNLENPDNNLAQAA